MNCMKKMMALFGLVALLGFGPTGCVSSGSSDPESVDISHSLPKGEALRWQHEVDQAQAQVRTCQAQHGNGCSQPACQQAAAIVAQHPAAGPDHLNGAYRGDGLFPATDSQLNAGFNGFVLHELVGRAQESRVSRQARLNAARMRMVNEIGGAPAPRGEPTPPPSGD